MEEITTIQFLPDGIRDTLDLVSAFDACFIPGFANLNSRHQQTLQSLQRVFAHTHLGQPLGECLTAIQRHEFLEPHFIALAMARAALHGAQFDALQQQVRTALGRPPIAELELPDQVAVLPTQLQAWLGSTRHWLIELALTGFARLDVSVLTPFMATLAQIQGEPTLTRLSVLLTGFFYELLEAAPVVDANNIPPARWVDLWVRAMVGAIGQPPPPLTEAVSGELCLFGFDIHQHDHVASLIAWGVLENDSRAQVCRVTLTSYKVGAISGDEVWLLFPQAALLLEAVAQRRVLLLEAMPMSLSGDLLWDGNANLGRKIDPMNLAAHWFDSGTSHSLTPVYLAPVDRHPIQLAEPIFLNDYTVQESEGDLRLEWGDGFALPVAMERVNSLTGMGYELLLQSSQLFGLLRFNAGYWSVQPLAVSTRLAKGKTQIFLSGEGGMMVWKKPPKNNNVAILHERASRLLRAR